MNIIDKFSMKDRCSIITGAAMGLGKAMAIALAQAGSNIVIIDTNIERAEKTANEIRIFGPEVFVIKADVSNQEDCLKAAKAAKSRFEKIDVLINNAGICIHEKAEDMKFADWKKVIDVDLNGVFLMSQAVGRIMIDQKRGSIINISSMSGLIVNTPQCQSSYNSAKSAVNMLTKSLAIEWAKYNIRVNSIAPGYMKTELTRPYFEENSDMVKRWLELMPMGRPGEPEEICGIALYLASEASSYTTGGVFVIDGGYTAW